MGAQLSTEEKVIVNVWTLMLCKRRIKCNEQALQTVFLWCKSQGVDATTEATFSTKKWEQASEVPHKIT